MNHRLLLFPLLFAILSQEQVFAHSFAYYASTPVTPPGEFLWWWPIAVFFLVLGVYVPLRMSLKWSRRFSAGISVLWVVVFSAIFYWIGTFAATSSTAPPPGLGPPCGTYWGRSFSEIGAIFLFWNGLGLLIFSAGPAYLLFKKRKEIEKGKRRAFWAWIVVMPVCFLIGLSPYIATGAWVHGWGGGYVMSSCRDQLGDLHFALVMYALEHDNKLPVAKDFEELYPQIQPYLPQYEYRNPWKDSNVCVIGKAFDRDPQPFVWNASLSGKEIVREGYSRPDEEENIPMIDSFYEGQITIYGKPWINCPYAPRTYTHLGEDAQKFEPAIFEKLRKYDGVYPP